ncbi:carboxymuconolactone decarboxylase family protein [Burkholderia thailandensis]|uniref:Carboxymuconolactone decarboxylase family protein n=1 Tax=Burkholderia thailandensis TaxID=57975 RepID=A0AAW9CY59_BURTH|nr:carboxymuconolactone decarboxylase family protein [Burkholderia thailandensis]MDW9255818.1 carboxymuconolactone decarboxylase family protein [Burkholderia thailandensis]
MRIAADQIVADRLSYARGRVRSVSGKCVSISRGIARPHAKDRTKRARRRGRLRAKALPFQCADAIARRTGWLGAG